MSLSLSPLIATLTLNPALDLTAATPVVRPTDKLRCTDPRRDPGGGGINVARVVHELGGRTLAVMPLGGAAGRQLDELMGCLGVPHHAIAIAGDTRESFTINETSTGEQYRFVLPGPRLAPDEIAACLAALEATEERPAYIVLSGSLPPGIDPSFISRFGQHCRDLGARLVVDMAGPRLREVQGAMLIKPNEQELAELIGRPLPDKEAIIDAARELIAAGTSENVLVSCGADGAVLVTPDASHIFAPLKVEGDSAVGAGDSMVGATVLALSRGWPIEKAACYGMAAGAAAFLTPATELVHRADVERLFAGYCR